MKRTQVELEIRNWLREFVNKPTVFMGNKEIAMQGFIKYKRNEAKELLKKWRKAEKE
jgi:hypothetical protein